MYTITSDWPNLGGPEDTGTVEFMNFEHRGDAMAYAITLTTMPRCERPERVQLYDHANNITTDIKREV